MDFKLKRLLVIAAVACAALSIQVSGLLRPIDASLSERRMAFSPRDAGGEVVFLGIDKLSLDAVGTWPWPRDIHAEIIRRLGDLGAAEIYFDIEFGTPSNAASDEILAQAIRTSPAAIVLPVLLQEATLSAGGRQIEAGLPLPMFRDAAWLATVNVIPDPDGVIRRFPYGQMVDGDELPSIPAMLSGVLGPSDSEFSIDFSISPDSVAVHSVAELLDGELGAEALRGKRIVVGAHAIELRDNFAVPVHGIISGAMLQILAAETLSQGRALVEPRMIVLVSTLAGLLSCLVFLPFLRSLRNALLALASASVTVEVAAFVVQSGLGLVAPTATLHLMIAGIAGGLIVQELHVLGWLLRFARLENRFSQEILRQVFDDSTDAILLVDEQNRIVNASRRAIELFGGPSSGQSDPFGELALPEALAADIRRSISDTKAGGWTDPGHADLTLGVAGETRIVEYHLVPSVLPLPSRSAGGAVGEGCVICVTARDVTDRRRREASLDRVSKIDELTGALRRAEFIRKLNGCPEDESGKAFVVYALKLRGFKTVNLTLGRRVGDDVLRSTVRRIGECDPRLGSVARLGSDVFAVHSACALDLDEAAAIGRVLVAAICEPYGSDRSTARVGVHVGVAFHEQPHGRDGETTLNNAEQALDEARKVFGDAVRSFDPDTSTRQEKARRIERSLWSALANDQFFVAYQPQVRLSDLKIIGAEALVRWRHPTMGMVSPGDFIEIAETSGFIEDLGRWVLHQACEDAAGWPADMSVAVNVSPVQFQRGDVIADVKRTLASTGLPASRLHLEITESFFVEGSDEIRETLHDLRTMGISLALDDFGSGFSSFGYLANFPLDKIKADQMFVRKLRPGDKNHAILKSIHLLAHELDLTLICEGIETSDQLEFLRSIGCEQGQGYLFGKPQSQQDLLEAIIDRASIAI